MPDLETPPTHIGSFRILREIGRGGMGCVYLAEDAQLHRQVAVKTMLPELREKPIAKERFLREARAMAGVKSDHIVTIHHVSESDGVPFFVMEYLEGLPLDQYLEAGQLTQIDELLRIGAEVCEGLRVAHSKGLIHRDIKPSNIFLEGPHRRVKILDFGLARPQEQINELTRSGDVVGSPHYMAPEQAAGEAVDFRADLFSLGAMLFRMTTGKLPFKGKTTYEVLMCLATHTPPRLEEMNPQVPVRLSELVEKLLRKKPDERPTSVDEVLADLQHVRLNRGEATNLILPKAEPSSQTPTVPRRPATPIPPSPGDATTSLAVEATSAPAPLSQAPTSRRRLWIAIGLVLFVGIGIYFLPRSSEDPAALASEYMDAFRSRNQPRLQELNQRLSRLSRADRDQVEQLIRMEVASDPTLLLKEFGGMMGDFMKGFGGMIESMKGMGGNPKGFPGFPFGP